MVGYKPINVKSFETGLVQNRQDFILPEDAFPNLTNAYVFRETIRRKQGLRILGRLQRNFDQNTPNYTSVIGTSSYDLFSILGITEPNASMVPGNLKTIQIIFAGGISQVLTDNTGTGVFTIAPAGTITSATINYDTGIVTLTANAAIGPVGSSFVGGYYPNLPVMGIRTQDINEINTEETIFFDTVYAYVFDSTVMQFKEFISGTTWNGTDYQFFWTTNYWVSDLTYFLTSNTSLFWETNFNYDQVTPDPIRITDGTTWVDFAPPNFGQLDTTGNLFILQALCILPFRGRLLMFNTVEGPALGDAATKVYPRRIRWSQIGNPLIPYSAGPPVEGSWLDTVRGKGGFLDIPTNENIVSVGFVRDNLVIYCQRSTWQLRYTGRSIAPFQIERVNSELGVNSTFSGVQFDTSIIGIGNLGIIECDSYKSDRIDLKIVDLVYQFNNNNNGLQRVYGVRDFVQKLAYWIYPNKSSNGTYPDRRLVYNYENKSWAIFTDSLTCLGLYQPNFDLTWENADVTWEEANFSWVSQPSYITSVMGGNQQGYVLFVGGSVEGGQTSNDQSLFIQGITGNGILSTDNPVEITSPSHNLQTGQIIQIVDLPITDSFYSYLNDNIYQANVIDNDTFYLTVYDSLTDQYNEPALAPSGTFVGYGQIKIRDNFSIQSKKFNYMDIGQQFQMGWVDILTSRTAQGAFAMKIYSDYNTTEATNTLPQNNVDDTFFNNVVPTNVATDGYAGGEGTTKLWNRVVCPTNSNFITIEYTFNNFQMQDDAQSSDVEIDAQIIYARPGGRQRVTL